MRYSKAGSALVPPPGVPCLDTKPTPMTKTELLAILAQYVDDQLVLVESPLGFEDPKVYVTAVRPRSANEHSNVLASDYVTPAQGETVQGAVVIGSAAGFLVPF